MPLNPNRLGPAFAVAAGLFYLGCVAIMAIAGKAALVAFFNGLFHGLDLSPILMDQVSVWITVTGFINTVVLSWLFGALIAVVYNLAGRIGRTKAQ
jgi:hypothetical protein